MSGPAQWGVWPRVRLPIRGIQLHAEGLIGNVWWPAIILWSCLTGALFQRGDANKSPAVCKQGGIPLPSLSLLNNGSPTWPDWMTSIKGRMDKGIKSLCQYCCCVTNWDNRGRLWECHTKDNTWDPENYCCLAWNYTGNSKLKWIFLS